MCGRRNSVDANNVSFYFNLISEFDNRIFTYDTYRDLQGSQWPLGLHPRDEQKGHMFPVTQIFYVVVRCLF